jgi:hypothetical protein
MKAIVQDRYGSADVRRLEDVDEPAIGADDRAGRRSTPTHPATA